MVFRYQNGGTLLGAQGKKTAVGSEIQILVHRPPQLLRMVVPAVRLADGGPGHRIAVAVVRENAHWELAVNQKWSCHVCLLLV